MKTTLLSLLLFFGFITTAIAAELPDGYAVDLDPEKYTTAITNPYLTLPIGKKMIFESKKENRQIEMEITGETKNIAGIETLLYTQTEYENKNRMQQTKHYIAQDSEGAVWNFGEEGVWMTEENGALPGMLIPAKPTREQVYRQSYAPNIAEDQAEVVSVNETVNDKEKQYTNCIKIVTTSRLEPELKKYTTYCKEVGGPVVIEEDGERMKLVSVESTAEKETPDTHTASAQEKEKSFVWKGVAVSGMIAIVFGLLVVLFIHRSQKK